MTATAKVTVAALTYRRPDELRRLLPLLVEQARDLDPPAAVLVVDNDPDAGARTVAGGIAGVTYVHEPRPGIAAGRNRALDQAADGDAIVFIDDDETPAPGWLRRLVDTWREEGVAAVGGPVLRNLEGLDPWIRATGLFEPYRFATGTRVRGGATNNLLLDLAWLRERDLRFDDRFGLTGGSDTMLLQSVLRAGGEIAWCDEARVTDIVPAQRLTRAWVRTRFFRTGNTWARVQLALAEASGDRVAPARLHHAARSAAWLLTGVAMLLAGTVTRRLRWQALGATRLYSSFGALWAYAGGVYTEYHRGPRRWGTVRRLFRR